MKSFKEFISEGSRGSFDTKSYIFYKYLYPALILSPTALKRVFGNLNKIKAWHVTEQYEIGTLVKLQGKKSSISALTEINPSKSKPFEGMETDGGVVVEVEGLELLATREDAWTELLDGGRRGINIDPKFFPNLYKDMRVLLDQIAEKYGKIISKYDDSEDTWFEIYGGKFSNMSNSESEQALEGIGDDLTQKDKGKFVKEYIDNCEQLLKKNKKGQEDLRQYGRAKSKKKDGSDYNEIVINQIKIKNVYLVKEMFDEDSTEDAIEDIKYGKWDGKIQLKTEKQLISLINKKKK